MRRFLKRCQLTTVPRFRFFLLKTWRVYSQGGGCFDEDSSPFLILTCVNFAQAHGDSCQPSREAFCSSLPVAASSSVPFPLQAVPYGIHPTFHCLRNSQLSVCLHKLKGCIYQSREAKDCWKPPKAGRGAQDRCSLRASRKNPPSDTLMSAIWSPERCEG